MASVKRKPLQGSDVVILQHNIAQQNISDSNETLIKKQNLSAHILCLRFLKTGRLGPAQSRDTPIGYK